MLYVLQLASGVMLRCLYHATELRDHAQMSMHASSCLSRVQVAVTNEGWYCASMPKEAATGWMTVSKAESGGKS